MEVYHERWEIGDGDGDGITHMATLYPIQKDLTLFGFSCVGAFSLKQRIECWRPTTCPRPFWKRSQRLQTRPSFDAKASDTTHAAIHEKCDQQLECVLGTERWPNGIVNMGKWREQHQSPLDATNEKSASSAWSAEPPPPVYGELASSMEIPACS
jgi:hypothetical protein